MVRKILQIGDPVLYKESTFIPEDQIKSQEIKALITDLIDTCKAHDSDTAGLSAVQIGIPKSVFVARRIDLDEERWDIFINPKLTRVSPVESEMWEGCMSIGEGEKRLFGPVSRSDEVAIAYLDSEGAKQNLLAKGYMAHIIQHEMDHLAGKLFLQYVSPDKLWTSKQLDEYLQEHGHYPKTD